MEQDFLSFGWLPISIKILANGRCSIGDNADFIHIMFWIADNSNDVIHLLGQLYRNDSADIERVVFDLSLVQH